MEHIGDQFILGLGPPASPQGQQMGNARLIRGEGLVTRISNDYRTQLPVVGKDILRTGGPVSCGDCPVVRDSE